MAGCFFALVIAWLKIEFYRKEKLFNLVYEFDFDEFDV